MNKRTSSGILAFTVVGFYYLWRNRNQVQQFFDKTGVPVNLDRISQRFSDRYNQIKQKLQATQQAERQELPRAG